MNNDSCRGYVILALKELGYKREEIEKIIDEMYYVFDLVAEEEAEQAYLNFCRGEEDE